jgi:leucyl/phenylalanyl-tRNA--protein transferase
MHGHSGATRCRLEVRVPVRLIRGDQPLPDPTDADPRGLVAVGGDLRPERLLDGYRRGIFPWYGDGLPILWHSPDPRFVLEPAALQVNRSLRKAIRRAPYRLTLDTAFDRVIRHCAAVPRPDQDGTWITNDMIAAYEQLHALGHAHSCEAWRGDELVGGVYGVTMGAVFCGESMFALAPDASKIAFVQLVQQLERWGFELIDCQVHTEHLERFGAVEWPRPRFLATLARLRDREVAPRGPWAFDLPQAIE